MQYKIYKKHFVSTSGTFLLFMICDDSDDGTIRARYVYGHMVNITTKLCTLAIFTCVHIVHTDSRSFYGTPSMRSCRLVFFSPWWRRQLHPSLSRRKYIRVWYMFICSTAVVYIYRVLLLQSATNDNCHFPFMDVGSVLTVKTKNQWTQDRTICTGKQFNHELLKVNHFYHLQATSLPYTYFYCHYSFAI